MDFKGKETLFLRSTLIIICRGYNSCLIPFLGDNHTCVVVIHLQVLKKFGDVVWHVSWSVTGNILAVSGGDNKVNSSSEVRNAALRLVFTSA